MTKRAVAPTSSPRGGRADARPDAYLGQDEAAGAMPAEVQAAFGAFPEGAARLLLTVRQALLAVADETGAGPLAETLKWGQPAYLTEATGAGTTVRLGLDGGTPAVFVHCRTRLIEDFRAEFPEAFRTSGRRALYLDKGFDRAALAIFLGRALTYRRRQRKTRA